MTPYEAARVAFDEYASLDAPKLPETLGSALQVVMYRWAMAKVKKHTLPLEVEGVLGVSEEMGELAAAIDKLNHAILNHHQDRRGMEDIQKLREACADGLADMILYSFHIATAMRLDLWTIVNETATRVLQRDWVTNPLDAHKEK